MRLSVLDQAPIREGGTGAEALENLFALARAADRLGYHRFWVAEHHATPALASAVPEILLARVLAETGRIRVGSGGVMLPHQSPFRVAESFSMLSALGPGRVDLGLGRAPGSDRLTAFALQQDRRARAPDDFGERVVELLAHFDGSLPADHPFRHLYRTLPGGEAVPDVWILGTSDDSARLAGALGLPYCIAEFIAGHRPELSDLYRACFRPRMAGSAPEVMVAVWCVAAETADEANWLAGSSRMMFARMLAGELMAVPHPDVAARWLAANPVPERPGYRPVVGDTAVVRDRLLEIGSAYGADEVLTVNILFDHAARMRSLALIAGVFGLGAPAAAGDEADHHQVRDREEMAPAIEAG